MSAADFLHWSLIAWYVLEWALRLIALIVLPRNRRPAAGMAWLLLIFLVPVLGWLCFALVGRTKLPRERRDVQRTIDRYIAQAVDMFRVQWGDASLVDVPVPSHYDSIAKLATHLTHLPATGGNSITPTTDYDDAIRRIIDDVRRATRYIYIEYYVIALDDTTEPLVSELEAEVQRGVVVRVLYDAYGSRRYPRRQELFARLRAAGVHVQAMLPFQLFGRHYTRPDLRNHRKLVIIDGLIGYTGSLNMIQRDYHRRDSIVYDELVVRCEGPVVFELAAVFVSDWHAETREIPAELDDGDRLVQPQSRGDSLAQIVPSGPGYEYENNLKLFNTSFYAARRRIVIVNPYFVPNESLIMSLTNAALRGVEVIIVNSQAIDQIVVAHAQRSYYEQMLRAGVRIYLYHEPTLLHSKYVLIDSDVALIGSSNMDIRSFELNQELTLVTYDAALAAQLHAITEDYLSRATEVHLDDWSRRPRRSQLLDNLARLTSSLQ